MKKELIDTITFDRLASEDYKEKAMLHWSSDPCGSNYTRKKRFSKQYFKEIEKHRYSTHPWIKEAIDSFDIQNAEVLEIGFGMGTDHLNLARRGAKMHGIDLSAEHHDITYARLKIWGFESQLMFGISFMKSTES